MLSSIYSNTAKILFDFNSFINEINFFALSLVPKTIEIFVVLEKNNWFDMIIHKIFFYRYNTENKNKYYYIFSPYKFVDHIAIHCTLFFSFFEHLIIKLNELF